MADLQTTTPPRPLRVLHLIDGLGGGGSERLLWDTVRLSDSACVRHLVATVSPDWFGDFYYAERLRATGAYSGADTPSHGQPFRFARWFGRIRDFIRTPSPGNPVSATLRFSLQVGALVVTFPRSIMAFARHRPDVVHTHTFYSFVHGIWLRLFLRVPVVHTVPCLFEQMSGAGFAWLPGFYRRNRLGALTYFTGASAADLASAGIPVDRIVKLSGGIDLAPIHAARANRDARRTAARQRLGLPADALVALNIGRLHESKGQRHAIAALARLVPTFPTLHLAILGEGEERDKLAALADSLGVGLRVHLPGFWEEPLDGCAAADIYLRTNLLEGDNLSSLQALGLGVPVAGFATGRETDVVRDTGAGLLVPVGDVAALANATRTILSREDRGAALGLVGAQYVDAHLGIGALLQAYESGYLRAIAQRPPPASPMKVALRWVAKFAVTAAIMGFVLTRIVDWPTLTHAVHSFPLSALGLMLLLHMVIRWVVAWQTKLSLAHAGTSFTTRRVFQLHLITSFFNVVLPGELAGAAVSWHLFSRDSGRRAQVAAALVYLRLISFFMLTLVGAVGLAVEPRLLALRAHWAVLGAGIIVGLPLLSFHSSTVAHVLKRISDAFTNRLPWAGLRSAFGSFWSSVHEFTALPRGTQAAIWAAAVGTYLINVTAGLVAMKGAQVQAPAIAIVWLLAIVTLMSLVPFTIAGFGVRELGVAVLLKQWYGVPTEAAVLFSLAIGVVAVIASAGFGGIALLFEVLAKRRKAFGLP